MLDRDEMDGLETYFALAAEKPDQFQDRLTANEVTSRVDAELAAALADPEGWMRANGPRVKKQFGRPLMRFAIKRHPEAKKLQPGDVDSIFATARGQGEVFENRLAMSDEQKKKWHDRINRWLPVLKVIATFTPPPYNFAVIGLIVILIIIDQNRLAPDVVSAILSPLMDI